MMSKTDLREQLSNTSWFVGISFSSFQFCSHFSERRTLLLARKLADVHVDLSLGVSFRASLLGSCDKDLSVWVSQTPRDLVTGAGAGQGTQAVSPSSSDVFTGLWDICCQGSAPGQAPSAAFNTQVGV